MSSKVDGGRLTVDGEEQEKAENREQRAESREAKIVMALLDVFTMEQLEQLSQLCVLVKDRAVIRKCTQTLTFEVNDKGYVRYFHLSDDVPAVKPKMYNSD